jgi:CRP/FNR family transcriptional regulator, nitrogen oxide reductase regulator
MAQSALSVEERKPSAVADLGKARLFQGLTRPEMERLAKAAQRLEVKPRSTLCICGEQAARLFLLVRGNVKYSRPTADGKEILLVWLSAGQTFGLGTILTAPPPYIATAHSLTHCELLVWQRSEIRQFSRDCPRLAINALAIALNHMAVWTSRHSGLLEQSAEQRLAAVLLDLANRAGEIQPSGGVQVRVNNEQLASLADTSLFTASRTMAAWQRRGLIRKSREQVEVRVPERLLSPS